MKRLLIAIFLVCPIFLLGQISDSTAQARGLIKIQPIQRSILDKDTIRFIGYDSSSVLNETAKRLIFWVRFYDKNGVQLEQRQLDANAATLFNYTWTTYVAGKKTYILNKWNLIEVAY